MGDQIVVKGCHCAFFDRAPVIVNRLSPCPVCGYLWPHFDAVFLDNGSARAQIKCKECGIVLTRDVWGGEFEKQVRTLWDMWNNMICAGK